jgi:hypothetical protein
MPIRKRGATWYVDVHLGGQRVVRSAGRGATRAEARELEAKIRQDLHAIRVGRAPERTIEQALARWLKGDARARLVPQVPLARQRAPALYIPATPHPSAGHRGGGQARHASGWALQCHRQSTLGAPPARLPPGVCRVGMARQADPHPAPAGAKRAARLSHSRRSGGPRPSMPESGGRRHVPARGVHRAETRRAIRAWARSRRPGLSLARLLLDASTKPGVRE